MPRLKLSPYSETSLMMENERLYQAYLLKEQALDIFDRGTRRSNCVASTGAVVRFANVKAAKHAPFDAVVKTIMPHLDASWTSSGISTPMRRTKPLPLKLTSSNRERTGFTTSTISR